MDPLVSSHVRHYPALIYTTESIMYCIARHILFQYINKCLVCLSGGSKTLLHLSNLLCHTLLGLSLQLLDRDFVVSRFLELSLDSNRPWHKSPMNQKSNIERPTKIGKEEDEKLDEDEKGGIHVKNNLDKAQNSCHQDSVLHVWASLNDELDFNPPSTEMCLVWRMKV
jgi:hypothetical protein